MISIIIPTYNEAACIANLVTYLKKQAGASAIEVIVSDAGSLDDTAALAAHSGAIVLQSPQKGRAAQMNFAASKASGDVFYFVHADCIPPTSFVADIHNALASNFDAGRYRTKFMSNGLLLKLNAYFTRFDLFVCYGGDQTFFITKKMFTKLNGYDEGKLIMEDYDLTERAKNTGRYTIMNKPAMVSARKYENNSWLAVQKANYKAIRMYKAGTATSIIAKAYKAKLKL